MSGFVLWLITQGRDNDQGLFLARRVARLVPVYWLVTLLLFVKDTLGWSAHAPPTTGELLQSLLFIPHFNGSGQIFPVLIPGWTLVFELFFCVLLTALLYVDDKRRIWVATLVFGGLATLGLALRPAGAIASTYTSLINLDFLAGLWLAAVWTRIRLPWSLALGLLAAGFAGSLIVLPAPLGGWAVLLTGLLSLMIVAGALGLERPDTPPIGWLRRIGDSAYSIYLWHIPVEGVVWLVLDRTGVDSPPLAIALATLASTGVGLVAYQWLEKPLTQFLFDQLDTRWKRLAPLATST